MTQAIQDVVTERQRQDEKWGVQNHTDPQWLAVLTEEVGEAGTEILKLEFSDEAGDAVLERLRTELVQVAAVAVAWVECIDRTR